MILVKVGQTVVEEHWRPNVFGYVERQRADGGVDVSTGTVGNRRRVASPHRRRAVGAVRGFEKGFHVVVGYRLEIGRAVAHRRRSLTVRVIYHEFLNLYATATVRPTHPKLNDVRCCYTDLRARVEQQSTDRSEYDADREEQRKDGFGSEDGPEHTVSAGGDRWLSM